MKDIFFFLFKILGTFVLFAISFLAFYEIFYSLPTIINPPSPELQEDAIVTATFAATGLFFILMAWTWNDK